MMKAKTAFLSAVLATALIGSSAFAAATPDVYKIGKTYLDCMAANGVRIFKRDATSNVVESTWGAYTKNFSMEFNPTFYQWTWISLAEKGQTPLQGYQVYLHGNAPEGKAMVLNGMLGQSMGVPSPSGGLPYPVGFVPQLAIRCKVYWENTLK